ncbi:MAG: hypothetical protein Cpurp_01900 [Chlorogloea purpurea SAG 13.99]|nr:hypothetical protein [Chlorogloea purpurea SAG 13.99]
MNQAQLIQQAKQQDLESIKALLNHSLQSRRVTISEVTLERENCLGIKIISRKVPNQYKLIPFLQEEFNSLGIPNIETIEVYGLAHTSEVPAWSDKITLSQDWKIENNIGKLDALPVLEESETETEGESEETPGTQPEQPSQPVYESPYKYQNPLENPAAFANPASQKQSTSMVPLLVALALGFAWGVVVGIPIGSMHSMNKSETPAPSPSPSPSPSATVSPSPVASPSR